MPSKTRETREIQKQRLSEAIESRSKLLVDQGTSEKDLAKDPQIKSFKAKVKQIDGALARIAFLAEQNVKMAEKQAQKKAQAEADRAEMIKPGAKPKSKKKVEEPVSEPTKKGGKAKGKQKSEGKKDSK
ncbi:MAG: hypothetical protein AB7V04_11590 [Desulfomonilaceae bacterium]